MSEKQILHITYGSVRHAPRLIHAARSGTENGYKVSVLGAPREIFASQPTTEIIDGIQAYLIPLLTQISLLSLGRAFGHLLFAQLGDETTPMPDNRIKVRTALNILLFNLWILRLGSRFKPDLIHCHEVWGLPASTLLAKLRRIPLVYDVWDPHFLQYQSQWKNRLVGGIERFLARRTTLIITASERMKAYFKNIVAVDVEYIGNWKRLADYDSIETSRLDLLRQELNIPDNALIVSYIGLLFESREIPTLLQAMQLIPDVYLIIAGRGTHRSQVIEASEYFENIKWLDWVNLSDVPLYTCLSDVVYWCVEDVPVSHIIVANKLFETFMAGNVMLARYGIGEMSEILEKTTTGYLLKEVTPESIAGALRELQNPKLLNEYKQNALAVRETYSWSHGEALLLNLYQKLLDK